MLYTTGNRFTWWVSNNTTPTGTPGTNRAPGANNVMSAYTQLLSALANDVYLVHIRITGANTSAAARDILVDIGVDPAGGSSYSVLVPYLLGSIATNDGCGQEYLFPIFIKAGSTVAARAQVNNATAGNCRIWITCFGLPTRPELVKSGSYVTAVGATSASSSGTAVTPGTSAAEGSWTSLGSSAEPHWWWQVGMGINDSTVSAQNYTIDLAKGDGSNKDIIFEDQMVLTSSAESMTRPLAAAAFNAYCETPASETIYGRMSASGTPDSNVSLIAYGVGG